MAETLQKEFPIHGLLPKKETEAWNFLTKYPEYDGRNVLIAILDSGVDPGASGFQTTPQGEPKILDLFDATGSGDVDTSTVVTAKDGKITGLSGRTLNIPESWENPTGEFHIGLKAMYSIYPSRLKSRLNKERKEKMWDKQHGKILSEALVDKEKANKENCKTENDRLSRDDRVAKADLLSSLDSSFSDCGPVLDCIVFHDGRTWRACVDTSEQGDLKSCKLMASYKEEHQYSTFSSLDMLNYSFNIYNNGNLLEICANAGSHGTHVAAIAAAYEPDCPERSGVAPGAQIISVKIGDSRLGGNEETSSAIVKAMIRVIQWKCDLVNMSFGEPSRWCNDGAVVDIISEACEKHGVLFVTSAGNAGPALSTVGAPAGSSCVISVGAHVTPDMMLAEYSMRETLPSTNYTWSSRGPTNSGDFGVDICAPGGAITSIPNWTLCGQDLMNGTSMSSPNCCGCIGLVISALKHRHVPYTTASLKRSLQNSAKRLEKIEIVSQGQGLVQVDRMFEYMMKHHGRTEDTILFNISVGDGARGIYVREPHTLAKKQQEYTVRIRPTFITNSKDVDVDEEGSQRAKIAYKISACLLSSESWVITPSHVELMNGERGFSVKLDLSGLAPGMHFAEISCYDCSNIEKGPLCKVPVTVLIPESPDKPMSNCYSFKDTFKPGQINRHFIHVPDGSTCAVMKIKSIEPSEPAARVTKQYVQLVPGQSYSDFSEEIFGVYRSDSYNESAVKVKENVTMEFCLGKWWSSLGKADIEYSIEFIGVTVPQNPVIIHPGGMPVTQLDIISKLKKVHATPCVSLTNQVITLRPSSATIEPQTSVREEFPDGKVMYSAIMEYNLKLTKASQVTPNFKLLSDLLYESPFISQMWQVYDSNKQHLLTGDAFTVKYKYTGNLQPGEYTIRLMLSHHDRKLLEQVKTTPIVAICKLPSAISVDVYGSQKQAILGGTKLTKVILAKGCPSSLFLGTISDDKLKALPTPVTAGCYLEGSISFLADYKQESSFPCYYMMTDMCKITDSKPSDSEDEKKDIQKEFDAAKLDLNVKWISKLDAVDGMKLYAQLLSEQTFSKLTLHTAALNVLEKQIQTELGKLGQGNVQQPEGEQENQEKKVPPMEELVKEFFQITRSVISDDSNVNKPELLSFMGTKNDNSEGAATRKTEMTKKKDQLVEVYLLHISMMSDLIIHNQPLDEADGDPIERLQAAWNDMLKFIDATDKKVTKAYIKYARANGKLSLAAQLITKSSDYNKDKEYSTMLVEIVSQLGWTHVEKYLKDWILVKYPKTYALF